MNTFALCDGTVVLPDRLLEQGNVVCRDGMIVSVDSSESIPSELQRIDCSGRFISPGFIDIHVHGGDGADFMDGTIEAVTTAKAAHLRHGTTTIFPTTTTGSAEQIRKMLEVCKQIA